MPAPPRARTTGSPTDRGERRVSVTPSLGGLDDEPAVRPNGGRGTSTRPAGEVERSSAAGSADVAVAVTALAPLGRRRRAPVRRGDEHLDRSAPRSTRRWRLPTSTTGRRSRAPGRPARGLPALGYDPRSRRLRRCTAASTPRANPLARHVGVRRRRLELHCRLLRTRPVRSAAAWLASVHWQRERGATARSGWRSACCSSIIAVFIGLRLVTDVPNVLSGGDARRVRVRVPVCGVSRGSPTPHPARGGVPVAGAVPAVARLPRTATSGAIGASVASPSSPG